MDIRGLTVTPRVDGKITGVPWWESPRAPANRSRVILSTAACEARSQGYESVSDSDLSNPCTLAHRPREFRRRLAAIGEVDSLPGPFHRYSISDSPLSTGPVPTTPCLECVSQVTRLRPRWADCTGSYCTPACELPQTATIPQRPRLEAQLTGLRVGEHSATGPVSSFSFPPTMEVVDSTESKAACGPNRVFETITSAYSPNIDLWKALMARCRSRQATVSTHVDGLRRNAFSSN